MFFKINIDEPCSTLTLFGMIGSSKGLLTFVEKPNAGSYKTQTINEKFLWIIFDTRRKELYLPCIGNSSFTAYLLTASRYQNVIARLNFE